MITGSRTTGLPRVVSDDDEAIHTMISSYQEIVGTRPSLALAKGVGDANYMFEKGIKCVTWGPGEVGLAHGTNEYVEVDKVINAAKVYAAMAVNWCGMTNLVGN
jgi:acetylornithine deacetylase